MEPQTSGAGGRTGGPPPTTCGYAGDFDDGPEKNSPARRQKKSYGPAVLERPSGPLGIASRYLRSAVAEARRIEWRSGSDHTALTTLFFILIVVYTLYSLTP